jgi:preQ(0) biosynthesis protein QueC
MDNNKCLVLLSGGIDSSTVLWWSIGNFGEIYALTFIYGQRHKIEVDFSKELAKRAGVKEHIIVDVAHLFSQSRGFKPNSRRGSTEG